MYTNANYSHINMFKSKDYLNCNSDVSSSMPRDTAIYFS